MKIISKELYDEILKFSIEFKLTKDELEYLVDMYSQKAKVIRKVIIN